MHTLKQADLTRDVTTLEPNKTLYDARNSLMVYNISRVVLAKDNKPLGILTEKDISRFLYEDTSGRNLKEIRLDEAASKQELITVSDETDLKTCAKLMIGNQISSIIIVDAAGNLKGIFTKSDIVEMYAKYYAKKRLVDDYMSKRVFTVDPDETVHMVLLLMANNKVSRVVVTKDSKPIGVITGRDLLPMSILSDAYFNKYQSETHKDQGTTKTQKRYPKYIPSGIKSIFLAREVMRYDPITISKDSDLANAARIMSRNNISGLPVVGSAGDLIGIVTKSDIVRAVYEVD
ncbi:MAG TPA: CBS domain-containing protein [Nitrososphaeraceae archaeon]|nr:CBS domain-containing protein [Nitrososphaeraceae archaeon]